MICKKCGSEIPDDSKFCPKCGYNNTKNDNKNGIGKKIIAVIAGLCIVLCIGIIGYSQYKLSKSLNTYKDFIQNEDYKSAQEYHNSQDNKNFKDKSEKYTEDYAKNLLDEDADKFVKIYNSGIISDDTYKEELKSNIRDKIKQIDAYSKENQTTYYDNIVLLLDYENIEDNQLKKELEDEVAFLRSLEASNKSYKSATDALETKAYLKAAGKFIEVIPEDKNYENAQSKITEIKNDVLNEIQNEVNNLLQQNKYNSALGVIDDGEKVYTDDTLENMKNQIKEQRDQYNAAEEQRKLSEHIAELQNTIKVYKCYSGSPDSAGGVDLYITYANMSDSKVIKYARFTCVPYNNVNDPVTCQIRRNSSFTAQDEGPYRKGEGNLSTYWYWQNAWYNSTIKYVKLTNIEIEYTDGTKYSIGPDDIQYVFK